MYEVRRKEGCPVTSKFKLGLSGNTLKIIAMLSMLIDHAGLYLFGDNVIMRTIGRISLPIFAYMIAEGCTYTKNRAKHLAMIAGLGIICQAVSVVMMGRWYMNILITFSLSIAIIYSIDALLEKGQPLVKAFAVLALAAIAFFVFALPRIFEDFVIDYKEFGVLLPVLLYYTKGRWRKLLGLTVMLLAMTAVSTRPTQWVCLAAVPLLALYNGKRGKMNLKYLFYIFYPTHLVLLYVIDEFLRH